MRSLAIIGLMAVVLLAGCGGDSLTGTTSTAGSTPTAVVSSIAVAASPANIATDGSTTSTISAVAKDANNNLVSGATMAFTATAGGLAITQATTDTNGLATATLNAGGAAAGTAITVTAGSGGKSGTAMVKVIDIKQTLTLLTTLPQIPSDSSKTATITALVRDANNNFVAGVAVKFTADSGGLSIARGTTDATGAATAPGTTDANGAATATLNAAGNFTNRLINVTASTGTATATIPVYVVGTTIAVTGPQNLVEPASGSFSVALLDASNNGIGMQTITLSSANKNTLSATTVTTDSTGRASFTLTAANSGSDTITASALGIQSATTVAVSNQNFAISAPAANANINLATAQPITVTWTSGAPVVGQTITFTSTRGTLSSPTATTDNTGTATVSVISSTSGPAIVAASGTGVTASVNVDFIANKPTKMAVQAAPSTVAVGAPSTITAVVRDAMNNLVEGQTVNFTLSDVTGGSLSVASALTNGQGIAATVYTANTATSATDGVIVSAALAGAPAVSGQATLTVAGRTVFLSLGTGNTINALNDAQYSITYAVQAIDSAGNGVDGIPVSMATTSDYYLYGYRQFDGTVWVTVATHGLCNTEDLNNNGILDPGEDVNLNTRLDPGAVAAVAPGSVTTANGGTATVTVVYPKDHSFYVGVTLTATASVQGTQSNTSTTFLLPGLAADFASATVSPPGPVSPYGRTGVCTAYPIS